MANECLKEIEEKFDKKELELNFGNNYCFKLFCGAGSYSNQKRISIKEVVYEKL